MLRFMAEPRVKASARMAVFSGAQQAMLAH
jgi:hypothetical protein